MSIVTFGFQSTKTFRQVFFGECWYEPVKRDSGKFFTRDGELCDSLIVGAVRFFTLGLVQGYHDGVKLDMEH